MDSSPNQENTSPTGENRQEDPMGAAGGAAAAEPSSSKDQEDVKLTTDSSDITTLLQKTEVTSHDIRLTQKEQNSTSSPANPEQQLSEDYDDVIPGDVKECMEEIISKLEEDLKATTSVIKTQPMTTTPNQGLVPTLPDNLKQKVVGQEGDDSPRAARNFWGKIDQDARDRTNTRLRFTPETSPTKPAAVSPGTRGGHQV